MVLFWLTHFSIIVFICLRGFRIHRNSPLNSYYWYGLFLKIISGIAFGLLYKHFLHGGDTWNLFESSGFLAYWAPSDPIGYIKVLLGASIPENLIADVEFQGQPRALVMIRILSLLSLITAGNYWLCATYLSIFAFFGLWALVNQISNTYPNSTHAAVLAFIFVPSVVLWSSGISKETLYMGVFGYLVAWFWPYFKRPNRYRVFTWVVALPMVLVLVQLKYYYMAVLLPVLFTTILHKMLVPEKSVWLTIWVTWLAIFTILIFFTTWLHPNFGLDYILILVKSNATEIASRTKPDSLITFIEHANPTWWMVINLPLATISGLFRPNLGDGGTLLQYLTIVENVVILVMFLGRLRTLRKNDWRQIDWIPCAVYVMILAVLLTMSTPNFGTLARYKVSFMPVLLFLILYKNIWFEKLVSQVKQIPHLRILSH